MIADAIAAVLPELRTEALGRMTSACIIRHRTGRKVQDEATGREVPEWVVVYEGACRIGGVGRGAAPSRAEAAPGGSEQVATRTLHLPHDVAGVSDGDLAEITTGLVGTVWRVTDSSASDQQTALRLPIVAERRPTEWGP